MKKLLIEILAEADNVDITGHKFIFPVKVMTEQGTFSHYNEELGLLKLYQCVGILNKKTGFANAEDRYFSQIGQRAGLKALIDSLVEDKKIEGRLIAQEFIESEIPDDYINRYFNNKNDDPKERYRKRAGKDGVYLKKNDEQIFRFILWVFDDTKDILVEHDEY